LLKIVAGVCYQREDVAIKSVDRQQPEPATMPTSAEAPSNAASKPTPEELARYRVRYVKLGRGGARASKVK